VHALQNAPFPGSIVGLRTPLRVPLLRRLLHALRDRQRRAAERRILLALDEHILRDIGMTRAEIQRRARQPA
jgi:uncharacterized protein YjiS (DUF1127 family)